MRGLSNMIKYRQFMRDRATWMTAILFLGLFFLLAFVSAVRESQTFDEPIHLVSGYAFWQTGLYHLDPLHPPLVRLWATLPHCILHAPWPGETSPYFYRDGWMLSFIWLFHGPWHPDRILLLGRSMIIVLGLGLGVLVWAWANQAYGKVAATAALVAYSVCPTVLAYSHYVTTDFGAAALSTLLLYVFWRDSDHPPARGKTFFKGVLFGLVLCSKFSEVIMIPIVGALLL